MRVAVIGGGIGGMTAAGLLAKNGREVVLFEQSDTLGGKAQQLTVGDLTFDTGPTLLALPHLVQEVFDTLGAKMPTLHRLPIQCHYRWSDGETFDVYDDATRTFAQAEPGLRTFYEEAERIYRYMGEPFLRQPLESFSGFMRAVLKNGIGAAFYGMRMGTLDALARKHVRSPRMQQLVGRFATYVGASPYKASAAYAMIAHVERAFGVHHPEGGMSALARALGDAIVRQGVEVRLNTRAQWQAGFIVNGERFDQLIVNSDPTEASGTELSLSAYVVLLQTPRQYPHHTIMFADDAKREFAALFEGVVPDDNTIYVCNPAVTDPTMHRGGLYVMVNVPPRQLDPTELRARLIERVAPGAIVLAERTPADFAKTGSPNGALYGAVGHGRFGPFRRPKIRGRLPHQFFTGGGTHPGGGVPMVTLSGRFAAEMALRAS